MNEKLQLNMINNIQLNNFRSYKDLQVELSKNINVFIGENGQGKTNLLEAIYFISNIRSHRTRSDKDLIHVEDDFARIIVNTEKNNKKEKIMCVIHAEGKYFSINNNVVAKTSDILGRINTILFYPNETKIFSDTPSSRRTFFDVEIGKTSKNYTRIFQEFNNLLKDRNRLLKEEKIDKILLDVITKKMIESQLFIINERKFITKFINNKIKNNLKKLSSDEFEIDMTYISSVKDLNFDEMLSKYNSNIDRDSFARTTTEGIHRDDYEFKTNGVEISKYLSQGQTRLVLLAIKFVLIDYIILKTKENPILLLDDVLSELDLNHQKKLIKSIPNYVQTIITTTEYNLVFKNADIRKYQIKESKILIKEDFDVKQ